MKKLISTFLVFVMLASLVACGNEKEITDNQTTTPDGTTDVNENITRADELSTEGTDVIIEENLGITESTVDNSSTTVKNNVSKPAEKPDTDTTKTSTVSTTKPAIIKPSTTKPSVTKPSVTKPSATKPSTTRPSTTKPNATKPVTPKPGTTAPAKPSVSVVTSSDIAKIQRGFLKLVNDERVRVGSQPLTQHQALTTAANIRGQEIPKCFSHTRPDGTSFETAIDVYAYPYFKIGENIQATTHMGNMGFTKDDLFVGTDEQIVAAYTTIYNNFKNSPGHYNNMINKDYMHTGICITYKIDDDTGMAIFYIVQIFGEK